MPEIWIPYLSAFLVGLVGGVHCIGMCGGIVSTLSLGLPAETRNNLWAMLPYQLSYNLGRIFSYVVAGAIMGGLGTLLVQWMPLQLAQKVLLGFAGTFMILLGLYIGGWWMALNQLEKVGGRLWKLIEPYGRGLIPIKTPAQAIKVGLIWGWVPCGLVYTMLINAVSTGSALNGAGVMLAFALGTLPNLVIMGMLAGAAAHLLHSKKVKKLAGLLIIGFGIYALLRLF
ncbi:MAG: sulfite exporter TauE/SafE family protein [Motiliproteus sp.]|nr:sulfite exporter TauE/SafE family protein [Motiliproteus sp.]MCW9051084.1 sulfite exporter TauE/SafE family protein [Motiliproteus sp.]